MYTIKVGHPYQLLFFATKSLNKDSDKKKKLPNILAKTRYLPIYLANFFLIQIFVQRFSGEEKWLVRMSKFDCVYIHHLQQLSTSFCHQNTYSCILPCRSFPLRTEWRVNITKGYVYFFQKVGHMTTCFGDKMRLEVAKCDEYVHNQSWTSVLATFLRH